jgi:hypothetical protein
MKIDIDKLTEAELIDLNHRVVERLRFLHQMRAHKAMLELSLGDRVCFQPDMRPLLFGVVTRYNKKTVTVITDSGEHWNVSPAALRKAFDVADPAGIVNVVQLHKK